MQPKIDALFDRVEKEILPGLCEVDPSFRVAGYEDAWFDLVAAGVVALMALEYFKGNEEGSRQLLEAAIASERWPLGEPGSMADPARKALLFYAAKTDCSEFKKYRTWCRALATERMAMFYDRTAPVAKPGEAPPPVTHRVWKRETEDFVVEFARSLEEWES